MLKVTVRAVVLRTANSPIAELGGPLRRMFRRTALLAVLTALAGTGEALAQKPVRGDVQQERARQFYRRAPARVAHAGALAVVAESEPNGDAASADPVTIGDQAIGEVNPAKDADFFVFTVTAGTTLDIDVDASQVGSPLDPTLELFDVDGVTSLAFNDDFDGLDSRIIFTIGVSGDYYVAIRAFAEAGGPGQTYTINFNTLTPGPGDPTTLFASGFEGPWGMAFDGGGNLYVAELFLDQVSRVTPAGAVSVFATGIPGPQSLAFDSFGDLLVTSVADRVYKVSPTGVPTAFLTDLITPTAITIGPDGDIWVADAGTATLRRYDAFGIFQESFDISVVGFVSSLAFSPVGELYLCNGFDSIFKLVGGVPQLFIQAPEFIETLAFDVDGFLYVANGFLGKVILYAPDGSVMDDPFARSNLGGPINLAFGRNADGTTNSRLFAANLGFNLSPPFAGGIVEMNPAGMRAAGWPIGGAVILPSTLPDALMGADYSAMLAVTDPGLSPTWSVISGALPPGISLDPATGALGDFPTEAGTFAFRVRAESGSLSLERDYSIAVTHPMLTVFDVAAHLLDGAGVLSAEELRFLDLLGNGNGVFDVGDFRAFLVATGALSSAALLTELMPQVDEPNDPESTRRSR